jgi:hypothetical protein
MAKMDYNSSTFRNADIDKFKGKFGQPKTSSASTSIATLANPWAKPGIQAVKAPSLDKPKAPAAPAAKPTEAKPETKPTAMAAEAKAPAAAPKTVKQVKQENKVAKLEARGKNAVSKVEARGSKTTEEKMGLREKRAQNAGNFVRGALEIAGLAATTATTIRSAKKN